MTNDMKGADKTVLFTYAMTMAAFLATVYMVII